MLFTLEAYMLLNIKYYDFHHSGLHEFRILKKLRRDFARAKGLMRLREYGDILRSRWEHLGVPPT